MKLNHCKTYVDKTEDISHNWHIVDASKIELGRLASEIAKLLTGKHKPTYTPHIDNGDWVIVINANKVKLTGNKEATKIYYRHSGYKGGIKQRTAGEQRALDSTKLIYLAIKGMLAKNKLQDLRLKRLKVYADDQHLHDGQKPTEYILKQTKGTK